MKRQLGVVLVGRGTALAALERFQESVQAYERGISVSLEAIAQSASPQFRQEATWDMIGAHEDLIRVWQTLKQPEKALQVMCSAVEAIEKLPSLQPWNAETLAGLYSQASGVISRRGPSLSIADAQRREAYARSAVAVLRRSIVAGKTRVGVWRDDRRLDALRARGDFQGLMMDAAMPLDPFARNH